VPSYEGLAGVIRGLATFVPRDLDLLGRGLVQSPANAMIEAGIAAAEVRSGRVADGRARLERLCARHPNAMTAGMSFARRLLENETLRLEIAEINRLSGELRWGEVIAMTDRALARPLEPAARQFMKTVRLRTVSHQKLHVAADLANRADFAGAMQTLEALLATEPEMAVEKEARRLLREVAKLREIDGVEIDRVECC
jgi:hypothetical protein